MNSGTTTFDPAAIWAAIPAEDQARIGAAVIELELCQRALEVVETYREERPYQAAWQLLFSDLGRLIEPHASAVFFGEDPLPLPPSIGPVCRVCGCCDTDACTCHWVEPDLCSACRPEPVRAAANAPIEDAA
jgi:hypothetical protein